MKAHARRRYIGSDGMKHTEFALHHRDKSPRYEGEPEPELCPYCSHSLAHSVELHEFAVHRTRRGVVR